MRKVVIATSNKNKKKELKALLKGLNVKVLSLADIEIHLPHIVEDGRTFRQNAIKKALIFSRYIDGITVADDSGLSVDALEGKPGVRSSRFAHARATDEENNAKLLKLMEKTPAANRQASFVCVVAVAQKGVLLGTSEGKCRGSIGFKPKGKNGFGYDPLFTPKGYERTFAELGAARKNRISHRAKALEKAKGTIRKYL